MVKVFTDYEEYKAEIENFVDGMVLGALLYMDKIDAVKAIMRLAENTPNARAPFLFQDEDFRHFNHDIAKRCRELLDSCNTK